MSSPDPALVTAPDSPPVSTPFDDTIGGRGQAHIQAWLLRVLGVKPAAMTYGCPWDMEVNGWRIEAKCAVFSRSRSVWFINIHRHKNIEENADFYVFRLEKGPTWKYAMYLVVPSPIGRKTVRISLRSLMGRNKWSRFINAAAPLRKTNPIQHKPHTRNGK